LSNVRALRPEPAARLEDLGKSFTRALRAENRPERTVTIYLQAVRFFSDWLEEQGRPATLDELTCAAIREWLAELADTRQPGTVSSVIAGSTDSAAGCSRKTRSQLTQCRG
jgi:site-specific recombinase XerD